ncbi:MAG: DUF1592 domain-containing protein [Verrucomicrobiaceae bacterium]|nr:DUF1592 domain-containing protein [Verrucomicrobiaceae bacterium]
MLSKTKTISLILGALLIAGAPALSIAAEPNPQLPKKHLTLFQNYCFDCHDAETQKGKINLEALPLEITPLRQAELWQKVLNAMNAGEMPPEDKRQPDKSAKADFLEALAQTMVAARKVLSDSGGKITMRRLNRREYQNTIEHLTGVRVAVASLPNDGGAGTFDTVGASQFISSDQFEQYLKLGRSAINEMLERQAALKEDARVFRVEPETTVNVQSEKNMRRMEETNERYLLWKAEVDKAALAPENREVMAQLREKFPGIDDRLRLRLYQNADRLNNGPDAKEFGFKDANAASFSHQGGYGRTYAYMKHYAELPDSDRGTYLKLTWAIQRIDVTPKPNNLPPGNYRMRVRAGTVDGSPAYRHFIEIGHPQRVNRVPGGFAGFPISSHQVTGTIKHPEIIETQVEVGLHTQREFGIQERQPTDRKRLRDAYNRDKRANGYGTPPAIWIDWIELEGPLPPPGPSSVLQQLFAKHADNDDASEAARAILADFARAALRRVEPAPKFIDQILTLYQSGRSAGESFDVAIRTPLSVILASPGFLYFNEPGDESAPRPLTDRELAVRLSYFLWSAPPDQELLDLAERHELHQPITLRQQVDRLIADPRSDEFVSGFVHQWLDMERLDFFQFDVSLHREFDENTRGAAREEVYQTFAHQLRHRESGRLGKLLKSDSVFVNGLLATYYGIEGVTGDDFREVPLPADSPRGGLLGMAAIHAMGSDGVESSPIERGAWVLRHLLHDPPPPAPPNVPQLSRLADKPLTTRERLAAHMEEAQCASCHRKIDPIGFGLENFDAAGKWRTTNSHRTRLKRGWKEGKTWEIDASGAFHNGPEFADYGEMRNLIAAHEEDFARGFTEHLIAYALGRPYGFTDEPLANHIMASAEENEFAVSEFLHALVQNEAFKSK